MGRISAYHGIEERETEDATKTRPTCEEKSYFGWMMYGRDGAHKSDK